MTSMMPLMMGPVLRRHIEQVVARYRSLVADRYGRLMAWYNHLEWYEKTIAALIVLFATLGLSVSSLGLWLILFSVKLPFWLIAASAALGKLLWSSLSKTIFKTIAFLQLGWAWRRVRRYLPKDYLDRKRRWDYRVARTVVRQRRMTVKQLHDSKDTLSMRWALLRAYFKTKRPGIEGPADSPKN